MAENEKTTAVQPAKKNKKPSRISRFFKRIGKWFRELRSEAKKVVWPTGKQVFNNTLVVIVMVIILGIFVYLLDFTFGFIRDVVARLV